MKKIIGYIFFIWTIQQAIHYGYTYGINSDSLFEWLYILMALFVGAKAINI